MLVVQSLDGSLACFLLWGEEMKDSLIQGFVEDDSAVDDKVWWLHSLILKWILQIKSNTIKKLELEMNKTGLESTLVNQFLLYEYGILKSIQTMDWRMNGTFPQD